MTNFQQLEHAALELSESQRAALAQRLLLSLRAASSEEDKDEAWLVEANRRARELDAGLVKPVPAEEVRQKAKLLTG
jgi:putative addiction module component (TIGR02574 family)